MKKTPRHKRIKDFRKIALTGRDIEIVLSVYENRYLRRDQIERLFFTTTSACNQRMQALYQHRFLDRIYPPIEFGLSQAVYTLDTRGAAVVAKQLGINKDQLKWSKRQNKVEHYFLEHTLGVSEIYVSLKTAIRETTGARVLFWKREAFLPKEKVLNPFKPGFTLPLIPDAFFGLETETGRSYYFVEVDRGSETLDRFRNKIIAYRGYWESDQFNERYNYKNFRVLTVTTSPERLKHLVDLAGSLGAKKMFLFTVDGLLSSVLKKSWYRPKSLDPISLLD